MSRYHFTLHSPADRDRALRAVSAAPEGSRVEVRAAKRTLAQNDRLWAMLSDVATQLPWHGIKLRPTDWKLIFLDGLKRERRMVPNIDGNGFVDLGRSSSDLSVGEMTDLITLIEAFAAQHDIKLRDRETV